MILFRIAAWDTNCPQHIPQKFDAADVAAALASRDARIAELEAELAALKGAARSSWLYAHAACCLVRPGELRIILRHHPVDIGGEIAELLGPLRATANSKNGVRMPASAPKAVASVPQGVSPNR